MNLIEQLGGYECAAYEYKNTLLADDFPYVIKATGTKFTRPELGVELLEHRRQHNIYEPGDFCFLRDKHYTELWLVTNILDDGRIELKTGKYGYPVPTRFWGLYYGRADGLIHASKEEIAAGHRIEIDQSGLEELSMYDIGPNVIVIDK